MTPPAELLFILLARQFHVTPAAIAEAPASDVLRWWQLVNDLIPPEKR